MYHVDLPAKKKKKKGKTKTSAQDKKPSKLKTFGNLLTLWGVEQKLDSDVDEAYFPAAPKARGATQSKIPGETLPQSADVSRERKIQQAHIRAE